MSKKRILIIVLAVLIVALIAVVIIIMKNSTSAFLDSMPDLPVSTPRVFSMYDIDVGMTEQEVKDICGWPDDESTYRSEYGIFDTYTYKKPSGKYIMVDFENGIVTSVGEY